MSVARAQLAFVLGGKNFTSWNSDEDKTNSTPISSDSADQSISTIVDKTKKHGKSISVLSWAGSKKADGSFEMNNFPIREQKRAEGNFNYRKELDTELKKAGLNPEDVETIIENDGDLNLMDSALNSDLKKGERAVGFLLGTGLSVSDGENYQSDGKFESISSADAMEMPNLEFFEPIEGPIRQYSEQDKPGTAAAYITAGHDGEEKLGAKATAKHIAELAKDPKKKKEFKHAINMLDHDDNFFHKVWRFLSFSHMRLRRAAKKSEIMKFFEEHKKITNEKLVELAEHGDKFAQKILRFTTKRIYEFVKAYLESKPDKKDPKKIFLYGEFSNALFGATKGPMKQLKNFLAKKLKRVSKAKLVVTNAAMDGAKDLAQKMSKA